MISGAGSPVTLRPHRGRRVMISCGEASGDLYAGALARQLRSLDRDIEIVGLGGDRLADAGATLVADIGGLSVTGLVEPLAKLRHHYAILRALRAAARERRPDVFVAVDYPDFNFRLLPDMLALGVPVVYYVSPQLWAWRAGRIRTLRRYVRRMLVIFPFERSLYEAAGLPVEFVGHPLFDVMPPAPPREAWLRSLGLDPVRPVVALLPGSRSNELRRLVPVLAEACPAIRALVDGVQFVVARAPDLPDALFTPLECAGACLVTGETDAVLEAADVVVTASGTATVQTALHGRPMVIVYRLSPVTFALARAVVRVPHVGMVNLVAGRPIVPELIQSHCTPEAVAREVGRIMTDQARAARMREDLSAVREALGGPGASRRAAEAVLTVAGR